MTLIDGPPHAESIARSFMNRLSKALRRRERMNGRVGTGSPRARASDPEDQPANALAKHLDLGGELL